MRPTVAAAAAGSRDGEWVAACAYAEELVRAYFRMLTVGCGCSDCASAWCASNPSAPRLSPGDAAIRSITLATTSPVPMCVSLAETSRRMLSPSASTSDKREEQPETIENDLDEASNGHDHADSDSDKRPCTPRRRLSTAMEIAQELHGGDNNGSSGRVEEPEQCGAAASSRPATEPRRRMSHTKQKLLDAIKSSFASRGKKVARSSETKA